MKRLRIKLENKLKSLLEPLCDQSSVISRDNFTYHLGDSGCLVFQKSCLMLDYDSWTNTFKDEYKIGQKIHPPLSTIIKAISDLEAKIKDRN